MIPEYLLNNPFSGSKWSADLKPVVILDGVVYAISSMCDPVSADIAYIVGGNQKAFEKVLELVASRVMHFYEMRVTDISALRCNPRLQELAIHWNTKLEDISPLAEIPGLKSLVLENTPKFYDLLPLSMCKEIECLEYSGGLWSKNRANSLEYISQLPKLKVLRLLNLSIETRGLKPLANLTNLLELELSNQFPTDDYAYLSVHLEKTKCNYFVPYVEIPNPIGGKDVMVIGSRKPFLNKVKNSKKIGYYVEQFKILKEKYAGTKTN